MYSINFTGFSISHSLALVQQWGSTQEEIRHWLHHLLERAWKAGHKTLPVLSLLSLPSDRCPPGEAEVGRGGGV